MIHKRSIQYLSMFLGAIGVSVALVLPRANAASYQQLVEAARKEAATGPLTVWASNPRAEKTRQALFKAFRKKYNMPDLKVEWLLLHPRDGAPRLIAETRAGKSGPDIAFGSFTTMLEVAQEGIIKPFDYVGTFQGKLPNIQESSVDRVPKEMRGKWIAIYDATRSFNYYTKKIKLSDVPDMVEGLADPKWSRKFAMSNTGSSPWALFSLRWGEERTINILRKLQANKPIFKRGTPATTNACATGEALICLGSIHEGERLKAKGAPIEWKVYGVESPGDYIPVLPQGYTITDKAVRPNLGHLFAAWVSTIGVEIVEKMDFSTRVTRPGSYLNNLMKKRAPNAKVLAPFTEKEFQAHKKFSKKVRRIIATGGGRRR